MNTAEAMDRQANQHAKAYMGEFAWPTVVFGCAVISAYLVCLGLALGGTLSPWVYVPMATVLTYLSYTVLHEAAHGSISGSHQNRRWVNEALGYAAGWILLIPLTAHRHEHLAHHRHTNDGDADPDALVGQMRNSLLHSAWTASQLILGQYRYYFAHRWDKAPTRQNIYLLLEGLAGIAPRLALLAAGFGGEVLWLFGVAWFAGLAITLYLFAYLVHRPHEAVGKYVDTATIVPPPGLRRIITGLWVFQNYHSIHHLFPRVPCYHYPRLFSEIEDIMICRGAPMYTLSLRGLQPPAPSPDPA